MDLESSFWKKMFFKDIEETYNFNNQNHEYSSQKYYSDNQQMFCTTQNIQECLRYLSLELTTLGFNELYEEQSPVFTFVNTINALYHLLQMNKQLVQDTADLQQKQLKINGDLNFLQSNKTRLQREIEKYKQMLASVQEKERQLNEKHKSSTAKLKLEKEENRKMLALINQRDSQYHHELRKKEREMDKLKDKLQHQITGRNQRRAPGIELSSLLTNPDGQRQKWKTPQNHIRDVENFYKTIMKQFQDRIQILMEENSSFRDSLFYIQKVINHYLDEQYSPCEDDDDDDDESENSSNDSLNSPNSNVASQFFNMPSDQLCTLLEKKLRSKMKRLRIHLEKNSSDGGSDDSSKSEGKNPETPECDVDRDINTEEKLSGLINSLTSTCHELQSIPRAFNSECMNRQKSFDLDDEILLQKEKALFRNQKVTFEKEREIFTNATIKLTKDKIAFDREKANLQKKTFLELEVPVLLKADSSQVTKHSISSCGDCDALPTTPELLKSLNLSPKHLIRGQLFKTIDFSPFAEKEQAHAWSCLDLSLQNSELLDEKSTVKRKSASHYSLIYDYD